MTEETATGIHMPVGGGTAATSKHRSLRIAVLWGGESAEREVSAQSASQVSSALSALGHVVSRHEITADLDFAFLRGEVDVAFIAAHGTHGEDGTIQGILELLHVPYIGSDVAASALCFDKYLTKQLLRTTDLHLPRGHSIPVSAAEPVKAIQEAGATYGYPLVVKPRRGGSTIGLSIIHSPDEAESAWNAAYPLGDVLVEECIMGTEITVAIVGNDPVCVCPPIEIVSHNPVYDYDAKYTPGASEHVIPARLQENVLGACRDAALLVHTTLGCRDLSRTDMIVDSSGIPHVLEVNTIPGLTQVSLLPDAANAAGVSFPSLCELLIDLALQRSTKEIHEATPQ